MRFYNRKNDCSDDNLEDVSDDNGSQVDCFTTVC